MGDVRFTNKGEPSYTKLMYDWIVANPQIKEITSFNAPKFGRDGLTLACSSLDYFKKKGLLIIVGTQIEKRANGSRVRTKIYQRAENFETIDIRFNSKRRENGRNLPKGIKRPRSLMTLLQPEDKAKTRRSSRKKIDLGKENINNWITEAEALVEMASDLISQLKKMVNENG